MRKSDLIIGLILVVNIFITFFQKNIESESHIKLTWDSILFIYAFFFI